MHDVSGALQRGVREYLVKEQDTRGVSNTEFARILGVVTSGWAQVRRQERGIGLEFLCRAIVAFPALFGVTVSFLASLVRETHVISAVEEQRERPAS